MAALLAVLLCHSSVSGQETKAPAPAVRTVTVNDADIQFSIGVVHYSGKGVPQDYAEAARWFRKAADQGYADAQFVLGSMYLNGEGLPQDYAEAARLYRKAAEQGYADAQANLGFLYNQGKGVPQDYAEAVRWFRKAADQGHADAQCSLANMYDEGEGVPQDYAEAHLWLNLAASRASGANQKKYAALRELVAKKMTPQQIAEAQRRAREWKSKSGAVESR